jgi:hypothetical protein
MKTIGLLGGMSWESTTIYYQLLNQQIKARLGGYRSAKILLHSVDFHDIEERMRSGDWDGIANYLARAAKGLEAAGAELLLLLYYPPIPARGRSRGSSLFSGNLWGQLPVERLLRPSLVH